MKKYIAAAALILSLLLAAYACVNSHYSDKDEEQPYVNETQPNVTETSSLLTENRNQKTTSKNTEQTQSTENIMPTYTAYEDLTEEQKLYEVNGLKFLMDINTARELMSGYNIISENEYYNDSGELISFIEYENAELYDENFNLVVHFKNTKLTGIEYYMICSEEESLDLYEEITAKIREVYPGRAWGDRVITSWYNPLGENTVIYVFNNETSIAVSFQLFDTTTREPFVTDEGLEFLMDTDAAKELMNGYNIISESEKADCNPGQITTVIEYENVELYGESFNLSLNFKNQKLTRLDYIMNCSAGETSQKYEEMIIKTEEKYGKCYNWDNYIAMWSNVPSGENSFIYIYLNIVIT